jgi:hypothetical protein
MTIRSGIQVILMIFPKKFERLQYLYYWREGFMKYAGLMDQSDMICSQSFMTIGPGNQVILININNSRDCSVGVADGSVL